MIHLPTITAAHNTNHDATNFDQMRTPVVDDRITPRDVLRMPVVPVDERPRAHGALQLLARDAQPPVLVGAVRQHHLAGGRRENVSTETYGS